MKPRSLVWACFICLCTLALLDRFVPLQESKATVALGSPDLMAFPCDTGYYRQAPHFCVTSQPLTYNSLTNDNTCRSLSALSTPTPSIDFMLVSFLATVPAKGVIGTSNTLVSIYVDNTCATLFDQIETNLYEQAVVGAGTELGRIRRQVWVPIVVVGNQSFIYYKSTGPATTLLQMGKLAYYDH